MLGGARVNKSHIFVCRDTKNPTIGWPSKSECTIVEEDMVGSVRPHLLDGLVDRVCHHSRIPFSGCGRCRPEDGIDTLDALKVCLRLCASVVSILGARSLLLCGGTGGTRQSLRDAAGRCSSLLVVAAEGPMTKRTCMCRGRQPPSLHCCCCWRGGAPTRHCCRPRPGSGPRLMAL
jgi:hypothetical protein